MSNKSMPVDVDDGVDNYLNLHRIHYGRRRTSPDANNNVSEPSLDAATDTSEYYQGGWPPAVIKELQ